jgi:hypothetical protein
VLICQADVSDASAMRDVVAQSLERFGVIHGVLHTAGVPGVGLMQLKTADDAARVLSPKVQGTMAVCAAVAQQPLDFVALFSSIVTAAGGGPGQVDYCAANAFLDAYAREQARAGRRIVSIGWGEWLWDAWQDGLQGFPEDVRRRLVATRRAYGISFTEGAEALSRAIASQLPHVFVTTRDVAVLVAESRQSIVASPGRPRHPRPVLASSYAAPTTALERTIAAVWEEWLGIDGVGVDDNFFELGGNSLIAVNAIDQIRRGLTLPALPAQVIFGCPTIATLAQHIELPDQDLAHTEDEDRQLEMRAAQFKHFQDVAMPDEAL